MLSGHQGGGATQDGVYAHFAVGGTNLRTNKGPPCMNCLGGVVGGGSGSTHQNKGRCRQGRELEPAHIHTSMKRQPKQSSAVCWMAAMQTWGHM